MKKKYFTPLVFFVVPTVICSALMWPPAAMKVTLIGGFSIMILSMIMTYVFGLRMVLKDKNLQDRGNEK
ncbi:MAG: hypothetical protein NTZ74_07640 [Chloroflexi bacterium]|nr:hypothetical protein [Chloroflexota bacterium]